MKNLLKFPLLAIAVLHLNAAVRADLINEFAPNPPGIDPGTQTIELFGTAGASASGFLYSIESDAIGSAGTIQQKDVVSGVYDSNGIFTFDIDDLENPSFTLVYATADLALSTDVDTDNDGLIDAGIDFGTVYDAVGITDTASSSEPLYAAQLGGTDLPYVGSGGSGEPELAFRDSLTRQWYMLRFDDVIIDSAGNPVDSTLFNIDPTMPTFGSANPTAVPEPATFGLLALLGVAWGIRQRRRPAVA